MGPSEGKSTVYYWPVYWHVLRLVPFLLLLFLLARKSNRTRHAWWMLLAVAVPLVFNWGLEKSGITQQISFVHESYLTIVISLVFLWLLSDMLVNMSHRRTLVKAIAILVLTGIFGLFISVDFDLSFTSREFNTVLAYVLFAGVAFASIVLTGFLCRKQYSPKRFLLWHAVITMAGGAIFMDLVIGMAFLLPRLLSGRSIDVRLLEFCFLDFKISVAIASAAVLLTTAPLIVLALLVPLYRCRFYAIFRLPGMDLEADGGYNGDRSEENEA